MADAAVHGYRLGLGMALDCDLVVAGGETKLQLTETFRGLGAAKQWAQFRFRGAGAFGDEASQTGRTFRKGSDGRQPDQPGGAEGAGDGSGNAAGTGRRRRPAFVGARDRQAASVVPGRCAREAGFHQAPMKLYLSDGFHAAALAFKEKRKPRAFKGR